MSEQKHAFQRGSLDHTAGGRQPVQDTRKAATAARAFGRLESAPTTTICRHGLPSLVVDTTTVYLMVDAGSMLKQLLYDDCVTVYHSSSQGCVTGLLSATREIKHRSNAKKTKTSKSSFERNTLQS